MLYQLFFQVKEWFKFMGVQEEEGQGLVEYALIVLLISIAVIAVLTLLGDQINDVFQAITNTLGGSIGGGGNT